MTRNNERQRRREKVRFLQSPFNNGQRLDIPHHYSHRSIIDPNSLQTCHNTAPPPVPDPEVYNFPTSYWPNPDTPLVPEQWSAVDVWDSCKKTRPCRLSPRLTSSQHNLCNNATTTVPQDSTDVSRIEITEQMESCLLRLDSASPENVHTLLEAARYAFTSSEIDIIRNEVPERRKKYIKILKENFAERGLGRAPDCTNPVHLLKMLKKGTYHERMKLMDNNICNRNEISGTLSTGNDDSGRGHAVTECRWCNYKC